MASVRGPSGAPGRTRTGTPLARQRILSPQRLPIPPPGHAPIRYHRRVDEQRFPPQNALINAAPGFVHVPLAGTAACGLPLINGTTRTGRGGCDGDLFIL